MRKTSMGSVVVLGAALSFSVFGAAPAAHAARCDGGVEYVLVENKAGNETKSLSGVVGKRNSHRTKDSTLSITLTVTKSYSSKATGEVKIKLGKAIAEVEGKANYEVAATSTDSKTVTSSMTVEPLHYGRMKATVRMVQWDEYKITENAQTCKTVKSATGNSWDLVRDEVFFPECQDKKNECDPH